MKSSLKNMVLVLFVICLVASGAVALVNNVTAEPIAKAQAQKVVAALKAVLPEFDNTPEAATVEGFEGVYYEAKSGDQTVGYAFESTSPNGFNGNVKLMVGFAVDGTIVNIEVLEQAETPGLGTNMTVADNVLLLSFRGKQAADVNMTVKKDGGDVDALTAATISSRAYTDAVARAYAAFKSVTTGEVNAYTSATQLKAQAESAAVAAEVPACGGCTKEEAQECGEGPHGNCGANCKHK
ncbi:MAG: RnfABCDGE type electron transport complex subunit G [Tidjanibacter sp.]|nr:RnfABCDGE type electron transport complex subunit G [Tidjanibacter sp.]